MISLFNNSFVHYVPMDYYSDKYESMCLEDSQDYSVDLVIKGNKIYKVKNHKWQIDFGQFSEFVDSLTIDYSYVLEKSSSDMTTLVQPLTGNYVNLFVHIDEATGEKYWEIESVIPELISSTN